MPKKKTIPTPDDFSSEFMETESAKELSEQQVEAAGSDNTETPLAEPPEVDLGSGDVSGTADVEENEPDAENTADAAETVPVSDEKAEDPEYDSILQELNSSTPAPLDSSGENALDALLLEENAENAPPAEDETESADGEAAPQPTAPPAPAGRRDSYILTVDAKDRIETEEERREVIWHEIKTSHIAGRILTGTLDGVEQTPSGRTIVVVDYKGYRIAIPLKEMMLYSGPVPYGAKYKPFMERMNSILATMLTAEIDFIVRGLDKLMPEDIEPQENKKVIQECVGVTCTKLSSPWTVYLSTLIAAHYCCRPYRSSVHGSKVSEIGFIGMEDDFKLCKLAFLYAYDCVASRCRQIRTQKGYPAKALREMCNSYGWGFCRGLSAAFQKQEAEHQEWGLVMVVPQVVEDAVSKMKRSNYKVSSKSSMNRQYAAMGYADGQEFDMRRRLEPSA